MKQSSRSGYNSLEFSSHPTYPWRARTGREFNLADRQARFSRISIQLPLRLRWLRHSLGSQSVGRSGLRFSRAIAITPRLASRIDDGTRRYHAVAVDNSRLRYRSYFSAVFAIAKQSESISTSARRSSTNPGSGWSIECRLFVVPRSFNESGISSILSPATWLTVRNRIRTRCCILMVVPIAWSYSPVDESFDRMRNCSGNNSHSTLPKRVTFISRG